MSMKRGQCDAMHGDDAVSCAIRGLEALVTRDGLATPEVHAAFAELWSAWRDAKNGAQTDTLTKLPNRACFERAIQRGIAQAKAHFARLVVMFLDLDGFKNVNDEHGHQVGDDLLNTVGQRIVSSVRESDLVARYGGDEFVVMLEEPCTPGIADMIATRIVDAVNMPYAVGPTALSLSISVGVAMYPDHARNAAELIRRADMAMYRAKARGGQRYVLYEPSFERRTDTRVMSRLLPPDMNGHAPKPKDYSGS